ncbi:ThiF family adenylyltransferase [Kordiimonas lipolytica]|uniref:ThiF family adenylyltransferase n=1 Tax=Kordiimonas lipolytica TaxID=1662421 RepID=A0ABV8UFV6_9PROT
METKGYKVDRSFQDFGTRFSGTESLQGKELRVDIVIRDDGFVERPKFYLPTFGNAVGILPHLDSYNNFCYSAPETLILDATRPGEAILLCRQIFLKELDKALSGRCSDEILDEFRFYWRGRSIATDIDSTYEGATSLHRWINEEYMVSLLTNNDRLKEFFANQHPREQGFKDYTTPAHVLKYSESAPFLKFQPDFRFLSDYLSWLKGFGGKLDDRVLEQMTSELGRSCPVFLNGTLGMYGLWPQGLPFKRKKGNEFKKPAVQKAAYQMFGSKIEVKRFFGRDIGDRYVYGRSLVRRATLEDKRICILGCGTIGSHLAKFSAQSGAGSGKNAELKLVDNQLHEPGNIGRHLLGHTALGISKSVALAKLLQGTYPGKNIQAVDRNAAEVFNGLGGYDLIIDATGDSTFSNGLNLFRKSQDQYPPVLFVWLEGLGAATQALLTLDNELACYRCLEPDFGERPRYSPLKAHKETYFESATCSDGAYIPYSVASSVMAAGLALEMMLDWAAGRPGKSLRTRLVDTDPQITKTVKDTSPSKHIRCPVCFPTS